MSAQKCVLGVCAARKKTESGAMAQMLDRLRAYGEFEIVVWGEEIAQDPEVPVSSWPRCDCLIAFTSSGFPLDRVKEYVKLRKPYCINDVFTQDIFNHRMALYELLEKNGIPTFRHIYADRRNGNDVKVTDTDDYIELDGKRMKKPVVEKPFDANDHNIHIYYSKSQGGGCRKLFRKVKNKSSEFFKHLNKIRRKGSFCYEQFVEAVKDLKVYTIGPNYAHGEVRKSPAVDGIVSRNPDGKEMRLLTLLTSEEREIARRICQVFKQNICGFDVVRHNGRAYVIDVNGWSFVKGNMRYYDKAARTIRKLCLGSRSGCLALEVKNPIVKKREAVFQDGDNNHTLLSMVTVFRHGDRTPKRKLKLKMKHPEMLWMFKNTKSEVKLRKRKQIIPFLKALYRLLKRLEVSSVKAEQQLCEQLKVVKMVVEHESKGLKIQLKPKKIKDGKVTECLLACKWGGELTWMGVEQAKFYAPVFWSEMLRATSPPSSTLMEQADRYTTYKKERSEFLKGLQVFAANESRVKASAKAFIRETIQNEDIPPNTLHSDTKVQDFLDDVSKAHDLIDVAKKQVKKLVTAAKILIKSDPRYAPTRTRPSSPAMSKNSSPTRDKKEKGKGSKKDLRNLVTPALRKLVNELQDLEIKKEKKKGAKLGEAALNRQKSLEDEENHDLTEWELRCLRWLKVPRKALRELYRLLRGLTKQIEDHVVEKGKRRSPVARTPRPPNEGGLDDLPTLNLDAKIGPVSHSKGLKDPKTPTKPLKEDPNVQRPTTPPTSPPTSPGPTPTVKREAKFEAPTTVKREATANFEPPPTDMKLFKPGTIMIATETSIDGEDEEQGAGYEDFDDYDDEAIRTRRLYHNESLEELQGRWGCILKEFYDPETDTYNTTKIPDIYDNIKYDSLHNRDMLKDIRKVYIAAKNVANFVIPQEYGVFRSQKLQIGRAITQPLLQHMFANLLKGMDQKASHRATLYFSSESHLHSLRNSILLSDLPRNKSVATTLEAMEINYMAHCVFRLFCDPTRGPNDPLRYYVDVQFAPGAALDPFIFMGKDHLLPVSRPIPVNGRVPLDKFKEFIDGKK